MINRATHWINRFLGLLNRQKGRPALAPIVPEGDVRGTGLAVVIAIMTFLACLALGSVNLINASAKSWEAQISREATIQIRPADGVDMEQALENAVGLVKTFPGISDARIVDRDATERLLEPWLGNGINIDDLPIPRLIIVTFLEGEIPDVDSIRELLQQNVPNATFDDHRVWVDRLVAMANVTVVIGVFIFMLVLTAMILTVVFATRGALSNNGHIVEVLHFIGAESGFVARQFDWYFLRTGFKGAFLGGGAALGLFLAISIWSSFNFATPEGSQMAVLFGTFQIGWISIIETLLLIAFVSFLTMFTSRYTVVKQLREIDRRESDFFGKAA